MKCKIENQSFLMPVNGKKEYHTQITSSDERILEPKHFSAVD